MTQEHFNGDSIMHDQPGRKTGLKRCEVIRLPKKGARVKLGESMEISEIETELQTGKSSSYKNLQRAVRDMIYDRGLCHP